MKRQISTRIKKSNLNNTAACMIFSGKILLMALLLSSCAHSYYIPKSPNVPLFTEKNEFRGAISVGAGEISTSTDVQAAYAVSDHFAIMSNFMSSNGSVYYEKNSAKTRYFDGAVGYFIPFDNFMVFEIYGGLGTGSQEHIYYSTNWNSGPVSTMDGKADLHYTKSFLQPSLGITFKAFDVALTPSISRLSFNVENNSLINTSIYYPELNLIEENKNQVLFEPAFTIRGGWKYVKIQLQYVYTYNLTTPDMFLERSKFSIGIYFSIAKKYKNAVKQNN